MRSRVSQLQYYQWAWPSLTGTDEPLREAVYDRILCGAAYPLPDAERRPVNGIRDEGGGRLALPPDSGVRPGDWLRPLGEEETRYEVVETRAFPVHAEAVLRLCGAEDRIREEGV